MFNNFGLNDSVTQGHTGKLGHSWAQNSDLLMLSPTPSPQDHPSIFENGFREEACLVARAQGLGLVCMVVQWAASWGVNYRALWSFQSVVVGSLPPLSVWQTRVLLIYTPAGHAINRCVDVQSQEVGAPDSPATRCKELALPSIGVICVTLLPSVISQVPMMSRGSV